MEDGSGKQRGDWQFTALRESGRDDFSAPKWWIGYTAVALWASALIRGFASIPIQHGMS